MFCRGSATASFGLGNSFPWARELHDPNRGIECRLLVLLIKYHTRSWLKSSYKRACESLIASTTTTATLTLNHHCYTYSTTTATLTFNHHCYPCLQPPLLPLLSTTTAILTFNHHCYPYLQPPLLPLPSTTTATLAFNHHCYPYLQPPLLPLPSTTTATLTFNHHCYPYRVIAMRNRVVVDMHWNICSLLVLKFVFMKRPFARKLCVGRKEKWSKNHRD